MINWTSHQRLLALAVPLILSNITTPLLGLVDSAVLGHLDQPFFLAGASLGALVLTQVYWICGFLRMTLTGLSAQFFGRGHKQVWPELTPAIVLALAIALLLLLVQQPLLAVSLELAGPNPEVSAVSQAYFGVRVWGAPFALLNLVLIGWLIGQQQTRLVLVIQIVANLVNGLFDIWFVYGLGWGVAGVAAASVIAEIIIASMAVLFLVAHHGRPRLRDFIPDWKPLWRLLSLNLDMALRNVFLQACLAFVTYQGARLGELTLATNALLMNFFVLIALGLDGIAQATEALVGAAKGQGDRRALHAWVMRGLLWSTFVALAYAIAFAFAGPWVIYQLTNIEALRQSASSFLAVITVLPLVAHWCFLLDGVFVGMTRARAMRDTMLISLCLGFLPLWWLTSKWGNTGLWLSLLGFFAARGISLGAYYYRIAHAGRLLD